ncbi:MAG: hypothetical protein ACKOB3_00520, partial [Holophagaceae bacterium]
RKKQIPAHTFPTPEKKQVSTEAARKTTKNDHLKQNNQYGILATDEEEDEMPIEVPSPQEEPPMGPSTEDLMRSEELDISFDEALDEFPTSQPNELEGLKQNMFNAGKKSNNQSKVDWNKIVRTTRERAAKPRGRGFGRGY